MKRHTMQEWCDFLGVAAVKNNFRVMNEPPGVFHNRQVTLFMSEPEVTPQRYGKPCYVDRTSERGMSDGKIWLEMSEIINMNNFYLLVSDLESCMTFDLKVPESYGDYMPFKELSAGSLQNMKTADLIEPVTGKSWTPTRGDPVEIASTRNKEIEL